MSDLGAAVITHLDEQLESSRRLLNHVLRQGAAVRRQEVDAVLQCVAAIQGEMERRSHLETHRGALLAHAGARLGTPPPEVTLDALASLLTPEEAAAARERSAELRGLLAEIQREHVINRALMRQELSFLEHLTRLIGADEETGYRPPGENAAAGPPAAAAVHRVLDLRA